jgi:hypothetical protein
VPYSHEIHPREKFALVVAEGACDLHQTIVEMTGLVRDPEFGPGFGILVDARRIEYAPGAEETRQLATAAAQSDFLLHHPVAIVVQQDLNYGIARMYSAMSALQGATAEVFRDMEEARTWLLAAVQGAPARERMEEGP